MDERIRKTIMSVAIGLTIWGLMSWVGTLFMSGMMGHSMGGFEEMGGGTDLGDFIVLSYVFSPKLLLAIIGIYNINLWKKPQVAKD